MAENTQVELDFDSVNIDESITETDIKNADNLSSGTPVGLFLCEIMSIAAVEKTMKEYSCVAGAMKFKVLDVIEIEKPVVDDDGKPVMRNGEQLQKVRPVTGKEKTVLNGVYQGMIISDEVNFSNPKEKEGMKNRRLFVARKIGILAANSTVLTGDMWKQVKGRKVTIRTEWNSWNDKTTGEVKRNVKVAFDGYESATTISSTAGSGSVQQAKTAEPDFSGI